MRPVVLGMNNPHSDDPQDVLSPRFPGSAGCRLYQMVRDVDPTLSEADYLTYLDRRNLMAGDKWCPSVAKVMSSDLRASLSGRRVVMLGTLVPPALGFRHDGQWYNWREADLTYCVVPHPSGLSRVYNDPEYRKRTGRLLAELIGEQKCAT